MYLYLISIFIPSILVGSVLLLHFKLFKNYKEYYSDESAFKYVERVMEIDGSFWAILIFMSFIPFVNVVIGFIFSVIMITSYIGKRKDIMEREKFKTDEVNAFYQMKCCESKVRTGHILLKNNSNELPFLHRCPVCEKQVTIRENLEITMPENYKSDIPYQKEFKSYREFKDILNNKSTNELYEEERERFLKISVERLKNESKDEHKKE